jgi:hypothetical protein
MEPKTAMHGASIALRFFSFFLWGMAYVAWPDSLMFFAAATSSLCAASTGIAAWLL